MTYELKQSLQSVLGQGYPRSKGNMAYHCPFKQCKSHGTSKTKLEVNLSTGVWRCWVCNTKGGSLRELFNALGKRTLSLPTIQSKSVELPNIFTKNTTTKSRVTLPPNFTLLYEAEDTLYSKKAFNYIQSRGVSLEDIVSYNIGYCEEGPFDGYVIFPNYSSDGTLTYYTTRAFSPEKRKTKNPPIERGDIVGFESRINWSLPLIIVESALDAITVKHNSCPLYGNELTKGLYHKLQTNQVKEVILCLDGDAAQRSREIAKNLTKTGINVKIVQLPQGEDPNSLGHEKVWEYINQAKSFRYNDLLFESIISRLK